MKILEKHLLIEFSKLLAMAYMAFIMLFVMVDVFENMDNLVKHHVPVVQSVAFFALKVPFVISQVSPVAVLLAVLLSLGILSKHNEVTAMKAGGVRLLRVLTPLFIAGLAVSLGVILLNEVVTPKALKKAESFKSVWFNTVEGAFGHQGLWLRTDEGILNVKKVDLRKNELSGVTIYDIVKPFAAKRRIAARVARWDGSVWAAPAAIVWTIEPGGIIKKSGETNFSIPGLGAPDELGSIDTNRENLGFLELGNYIENLEAEGYDASKYRFDLYGKITFPLVNFIMVLVGIPFALKTGRHSGIAMGVGLSVIIAFSYWLIFAVTKSLCTSGILPPLASALFPDVIFAAVGLLAYGHVNE